MTALPRPSASDTLGTTGVELDQVLDQYADLIEAVEATAGAALPKAGGTMTGPIVLAADPAAAMQPATKQYVDDALGTGTTALFLPTSRFKVVAGSPSESHVNSWPVWLLDDTADEGVSCTVGIGEIPPGWLTFDIDVWAIKIAAGAGNYVLSVSEGVYGSAGVVNLDSSSNTTTTAGAQNAIKVTIAYGGVAVPGASELVTIRVRRLGSEGADTLAGDIGFLGVRLRKAS